MLSVEEVWRRGENKRKEKSEGYYGVKSEGCARVRLGAPDPSKGRIGREKTPTYILVKSPMSRRHLDLFHMTICHMGFQTTHSPPSMFQLTPEPVWNESRPSSNTLFLPSGTHCSMSPHPTINPKLHLNISQPSPTGIYGTVRVFAHTRQYLSIYNLCCKICENSRLTLYCN